MKITQSLQLELERLQSEVEALRRDVGAVRQVLFEIHVMDIDRTALAEQKIELPWEAPEAQLASGPTESFKFKMFDSAKLPWQETIERLRQQQLVRVLAEPRIATMAGREALFNAGGEVPNLAPGPNSSVHVEFKRFGTEVWLLPRDLV